MHDPSTKFYAKYFIFQNEAEMRVRLKCKNINDSRLQRRLVASLRRFYYERQVNYNV